MWFINLIEYMWKFLIFLMIVLYFIYYLSVVFQFLFNAIHFTNRKMSLLRAIIPFYFWVASTNEKEKEKKSNLVKPIKTN